MSSSPVRSPPHLQRTNTYPGDAACLAQTFVKHEKKLPAKERSRLAWLGVVAGVVDHAFSNDWSELRYAKDIEQMMRKWTNELDNKSSASIPDWTNAKKLGYLRPLLYRNFDFYLFVLRQARENYGKDDAEFYETELAPTWLTSDTSFCRLITRSEWESSQVSQDLRSQVLLALHQSKPVEQTVAIALHTIKHAGAVDAADAVAHIPRRTHSSATQFARRAKETIRLVDGNDAAEHPHSSQSLSHRAPMGYRQNAIYYGRRLA